MPIVKVVHREVAEEPKAPLTFAKLGFMEIFCRVTEALPRTVRQKVSEGAYGIVPGSAKFMVDDSYTEVSRNTPLIRLNATLSDVHEAPEQ